MFHLDSHDRLSSDEYLSASLKTDGRYSPVCRRKVFPLQKLNLALCMEIKESL